MAGPVRFVIMVLWIAIALDTLGTLRGCTRTFADKAAHSQQQENLELGQWNRLLNAK